MVVVLNCQSKDFMKAAYKEDDWPEQLSDQAISTCNSLKTQIKVRSSSTQLESKKPPAPDPASSLHGSMDFLRQLLAMAKDLDAHRPAEVTRSSLHHSSSSQSLQSKPSNEVLALPTVEPDPVEEQKLPVETNKTLEQFEQEAFERLQSRQSGGKGKTKGKGKGNKSKKSPKATTGKGTGKHHACKSKPTKEEKAVMKKPASSIPSKTKPKRNCWGCTRCRGAPAGCSSCDFAEFAGVRLNGRAKWVDYVNEQKRKRSMQ